MEVGIRIHGDYFKNFVNDEADPANIAKNPVRQPAFDSVEQRMFPQVYSIQTRLTISYAIN